jgi:hypothetical protein
VAHAINDRQGRHLSPMTRIRTLIAACLALGAVAVAAPASASAAPVVGFNDTFAVNELSRSIPLSQQFGVTSNRLFIRWDWIQAGGIDKYDWTSADAQYAAFRAAGQRPFWVVNGTPGWALPPECAGALPTQCPPMRESLGGYRDFIRQLVSRYPESAGIEIGNEPNLNHSWLTPDPSRYAELLRSGYEAVKSVTPNIPVLIGGLTPGAVSGNGIGATDFLDALYNLGAKDYSDGIGYHVYVAGHVREVAPDIKQAMSQAIAVRDRHGDDGKFWITETGFPSTGKSQYSDATFDEATQGQRLAIAYRVFKSMPEVGGIYIFRLLDSPDGNGLEQSMGLFRTDGSPKPAVQALRDALNDPVAWPNYTIGVTGPKKAVSGSRFVIRAAGYNGPGPVKYEWLLKRPAGHWSLPFATTTKPATGVKYGKSAKYTIGVRVVTEFDTYTVANGVTVQVTPKPKAAAKKKSAKKKKAAAKKKSKKKKKKSKKGKK